MRRCIAALLAAVTLLSGCGAQQLYTRDYYQYFDTIITVTGYDMDEQHFELMADTAEQCFSRLHKLFDAYNSYEGIVNIKTINDNAASRTVTISREITDILQSGVHWYDETGGKLDIALGEVLKVWRIYREMASPHSEQNAIPSEQKLLQAAASSDIGALQFDGDSVFIDNAETTVDVGAIAKGYALQQARLQLEAAGFDSFIISAGGDVYVSANPPRGKRTWTVGVQHPDGGIAFKLYVNGMAVVTSGDYQRYYTSDGKRYHHLIDPDTLQPARLYRSVTVVANDAAVADALSTAAFVMPYQAAVALLDKYGADAFFILPDGSVRKTANAQQLLQP